MLDTGAAVSLLRADVWNKIVPVVNTTLQEWNGCQLVGAEGSAIKLLGIVSITITLAGISVSKISSDRSFEH